MVYFDEIGWRFKMKSDMSQRKWSFISPDEAYKDPIALIEPKSSTRLNQGRVFALAKESGYDGPWYSSQTLARTQA